jgi:hypothetical protein
MNKETQTAMLRKIRQRIYSFYKQEDKKRNLELVDAHDSGDFESHDHFEMPTLQLTEVPGPRYHMEEIYPPHDYALVDYEPGGSPYLEKAINLDGTESPFYEIYTESRKDSNEINLSLVYGQNFNTVYPGHLSGAGKSANFGHFIRFEGPLDRDIFIKSHTYAAIQNEKEKIFYLDRGNCGVEVLGIEGYIQSTLHIVSENGPDGTSSYNFYKFLDVRESGDTRTENFQSICSVDNIIRVPAGISEVIYTAGVKGGIYGSKDFSQTLTLRNDQYGYALLDLRHEVRGSQTPILRDPLGAWEKQAFGGVKFFTRIEFYEAVI